MMVKRTTGNGATPKTDDSDLMQRAVCLVLTVESLGNRKKVSNSDVDVECDKDMIAVSKTLLDSPQLKEIRQWDGMNRTWLYSRALPSFFKGGIHLIPNALLAEVDEVLVDYAAERKALVEKFIEEYPVLIADARARLRNLFDADEYPDEAKVRAAFAVKWRYVTFATPDTLKGINKAIFEREQKKTVEAWGEVREGITKVLRAAAADMVDHLVERLKPDAKTGKAKVFRDSAVENLQDFLETFSAIISGFEIDKSLLNPMLFAFQRDIVAWALRRGRASIFADCGLGKTPMQLEWAKQVTANTQGDVLILAPLAVSQQTVGGGSCWTNRVS